MKTSDSALRFERWVMQTRPGASQPAPGYLSKRHIQVTISDDLFRTVPVGEENAVTSRLIWEQIGMWSPRSVRCRLQIMTAKGLIKSRVTCRGHIKIRLFYRSGDD